MTEATESVFLTTHKSEFKPLVIKSPDRTGSLGFNRDIPPETQKSLTNDFNDFFERTYTIVEDFSRPAGGEKEDLARKNLPTPQVNMLEKDNKHYFEILLSPQITLITEAQPKKVFIKFFDVYEGLPISHLLISGQDGSVIDVASTSIGVPAENLFSFAERTSNYNKPRRYKLDDQTVFEYGPQTSLGMLTKVDKDKKIEWDPEAFVYLYLHENGHAALTAFEEPGISDAKSERDVNALALNLVRRLNKAYPEAKYFDDEQFKIWIEQQLRQGYDRSVTAEDLQSRDYYELDTIASNEFRAIIRNKLLKKEDKP